eukprot:TRINITY_DN63309_c0_g1_i1.p2 TRINITY_DN63309_c0_g1~~TRINITY_DN63309_c0_g1_i1.p2  ORF type:complete len:128 (+),score=6.47 TRINITY_DN63309_c0_g1_i1:34-384(+)
MNNRKDGALYIKNIENINNKQCRNILVGRHIYTKVQKKQQLKSILLVQQVTQKLQKQFVYIQTIFLAKRKKIGTVFSNQDAQSMLITGNKQSQTPESVQTKNKNYLLLQKLLQLSG